MADKNDAVRRVTERLLGDEALGGELTDDGIAPLLRWAADAVKAFAPSAKDAAAVEEYGGLVRGVLEEAVAAAEDGKIADLHKLLAWRGDAPADGVSRLTQVRLGDDADDNAVRLAAALRTLLPAARVAKPARPGKKPPKR